MYPEDRPLELKKLSDTRWACRESALRTMRKVIPALKQFLEEIVQKHPPDAPTGDASILLQSINFEFIFCLDIANPVFQEIAYVSNALQQKDFDLAASYRILEGVLQSLRELRNDEKFQEIFTNVKERAESMAIDLPSAIPGQGRRRKIPERFKYSATSATEDQQYQSLDEYYHNTAAAMLNLMKENNVQEILTLMLELLTIYAILPVTTATTVEKTFSKLRLVETKLRSLSNEERSSDLLLLAVEKDITINNSEVISIFKEIAHRRVLL
ncbi:uncharacterized protein [Palaemon carinicauda]|uniref:uncharacterized protein n=1 Tax=Palaemon carinicauda TaxID=392227 RepID=UPI0035B60933